jgi:hypothetical protein
MTTKFHERMSEAIKAMGGVNQAARALSTATNRKVWPSALQNLVSAETKTGKPLTFSKYTADIAALSGYSLHWLMTGEGDPFAAKPESNLGSARASTVNHEDAKAWQEIEENVNELTSRGVSKHEVAEFLRMLLRTASGPDRETK